MGGVEASTKCSETMITHVSDEGLPPLVGARLVPWNGVATRRPHDVSTTEQLQYPSNATDAPS